MARDCLRAQIPTRKGLIPCSMLPRHGENTGSIAVGDTKPATAVKVIEDAAKGASN